ncbi:VOC family protein, partial [Rhizobium redzepovicii]
GHDHKSFADGGSSAGEMLRFSRPMKMPDGSKSVGSFKLAFAGDLRAPDFFLFTCQRINPLPADRGALETHANGATGIAEIALCAPDPAAFAAFVGLAAAQSAVEKTGFGVNI